MALKIEISEFSDFCFGVKRAISLAEKALKEHPAPVFSLGPLIHNRQVVGGLSQKGLSVAKDYKKVKNGTVVIRSHGVAPDILSKLKKKKIDIVDATCPFVKNAQALAKKLSQSGYTVIVTGDKGHPEVKSLKIFSGKRTSVVSSAGDAKKLKLKAGKIGVIAQTTQSSKNFLDVISELLKKEFSEIRIFNTICRDASMRQESTKRYSSNNDAVIIVGGKNSANTKRLHEICRTMGRESYHIETGKEIRDKWLKGKRTIGIVSGASTPRWIVDDVITRLKKCSRSR
jgi:4-hydroxy-3-methylbut-2-enyl diphosphate reductase